MVVAVLVITPLSALKVPDQSPMLKDAKKLLGIRGADSKTKNNNPILYCHLAVIWFFSHFFISSMSNIPIDEIMVVIIKKEMNVFIGSSAFR